eukprot:scaffold14582_cov108-Isochrysis_galbana.AAC.14
MDRSTLCWSRLTRSGGSCTYESDRRPAELWSGVRRLAAAPRRIGQSRRQGTARLRAVHPAPTAVQPGQRLDPCRHNTC